MERDLKTYLEKYVGLEIEGEPTESDLEMALKHRELMLQDRGVSAETKAEISLFELKLQDLCGFSGCG